MSAKLEYMTRFMTNNLPTDGVRMTAKMPDRLSRKLSMRWPAEGATPPLMTAASNRPSTKVKAATARKLARHPIVAVEKASGAVAMSVPTVPTPICRPVSVAKRSGGNRSA
jgi:hypothetical protein